jgi:hypothetical protein
VRVWCRLFGHRPESMPWEADNPNLVPVHPELYGRRCLRCGVWLGARWGELEPT